MLGDVLANLLRVEVSLWQQRAGYRTQREQKQQRQGCAHRRQRAPGVAGPREDAPHIGSFASVTKASRTHEMKSFHTPVTSASPTAISSTPPKIWIARVWRRSQPRPCTARAEPKANST